MASTSNNTSNTPSKTSGIELNDYITLKDLQILNVIQNNQNTNIIKTEVNNDESIILSDTDEQLLITIPFAINMKINSFSIDATNIPTNSAAPKKIKLFINAPNINFAEASASQATQEFLVTKDQINNKLPIEVKTLKFQKVYALTLFIEENMNGSDVTALNKIRINGTPVVSTNMNNLKATGCCGAESSPSDITLSQLAVGAKNIIDTNNQSTPFLSLTNKVVGFYFSAHWCGPCRQFTPLLAQKYTQWKNRGKNIEIVFVSRDRNAEEFKSYFSTMPWKAIPFEDSTREEITSKFNVNGIPALILIDSTGKVISMDGASLVRNNDESFLGK